MKKYLLSLACLGLGTGHLGAEVKLPSIFGDHMVLQSGVPLPVWGKADPGEPVKVNFAGKVASTTADAKGDWKLRLEAVPASDQAGELIVTGKNTVKFADVLVGEVWVCSGQSNMVASSRNLVSKEVGEMKQIRFFITPQTANIEPQDWVEGKWVVCEPNPTFENPYSGVGYHFAVDIQKNRRCPVGMIQSAWGGTAIAPWITLAAFEKSDSFKKVAEQVTAQRVKVPENMAKYEKETLPAWEEKHRQWEAAKAQPAAAPAAAGEGQEGAKTNPGAEPKRPTAPGRDSGTATALFNGMIYPHVPYAIKGVLWYQGESNAQTEDRCQEYAKSLELLIKGWREAWGQGEFPFLIVQLPSFTVDRPWMTLRNSQFKALATPNTGLAVTLDLNPTDNLHPPRKNAVGQRLALVALRMAYGEKLVAMGPLYQSMKVEGNKIRVTFSEVGGGLVLGGPPPDYVSPKNDVSAEKSLLGFQVAAADGVWVPAQAEIQGDSVLVWNDSVAQPVHVSYAWANYPKANLYNKEGLPAAPFRSDDLPEFLQGK